MSGIEKTALQVAVLCGSLIPIGAGLSGIMRGASMMGVADAPVDLDSHFRYLSGILLAIGLGYATAVPRIETRAARFKLLTALVVVGGVGRAISLAMIGTPSRTMVFALFMELLVTPGLALWQFRISRFR